jgi:hypothetical protein
MKPVTIKCLLDSGAAETLVIEKYCKKLKLKVYSRWNAYHFEEVQGYLQHT